jgi:cyclic dehypoxanthinyl futalosine synthase
MDDFLKLMTKAVAGEFLTPEEGLYLYEHAPLPDLMMHAHALRMKLHPHRYVGWIIDRNVNITNVCISRCKFCNFHRIPGDEDTYITATDAYFPRIRELFELGGNQLLMQGGLHPQLGLDFYTCLFRALKKEFPAVRLHALGPPEVAHLARLSKKSFREVLEALNMAGLDSLPGAGAEILSDRVRKALSPGKCNTADWLEVMRIAHSMNLPTSATMMFGHIETNEERIEHLVKLRMVQAEKPANAWGFVTFVPWPFQDENTNLKMRKGISNSVTAEGYIRMIAISRLMMPNIHNIQASWLTVGKETAQICLHAGANDFGSIMIEEHVVSSAGAKNSFNREEIQEAIREAGFIPRHRNQKYEWEEPGRAMGDWRLGIGNTEIQ